MDSAGTKRAGEDFDAGGKRQRVAGESKVLHVRGLPTYCTEEELLCIVQPFGTVSKCLILAEKHQAFIEMASVDQAAQLLSQLEFSQPTIRSKAIYFQYSSRQTVEIKHSQGAQGGQGGDGVGGSPTLLITVSNVTVPVTLDNIVQICKPYGEVLKVITFQKGVDFQALVQMNSVETATQAKMFLEGKDMFQGCCHLHVGFSKRHNLTVKTNNAKSRDFTLPNGGMQGVGMQQPAFTGMGAMGQMGGFPGMPGMDAMGAMGGMPGMGGMAGGAHAHAPADPYGMAAPGDYGQSYGRGSYGQPAFAQQPQGAMGGQTPVVLVSELNEQIDTETTSAALFTLFGVYGDVLRVKILYNKRNTALVQFVSPLQASLATSHLNNCPLYGSLIKVAPSKFMEVKLPMVREGEANPESQLTKDYTDSPGHRYRGRQINQRNVNAPSQVLHLANLHDACTEQELRDLFAAHQAGAPPVVEFFKTSRKMCYVAMVSVEAAVSALLVLHNQQLGNFPIRVSFSPKAVSEISNSDQ